MREARAGQLRRRRHPVHDSARVEDAAREHRGLVRDLVLVDERPLCPGQPCDRLLLLDRGRDALERTRRPTTAGIARLGVACLRERALREPMADRVNDRLDHVCAGEHALEQLDRGQVAGPEQQERLGGGEVAEVIRHEAARAAASTASWCGCSSWPGTPARKAKGSSIPAERPESASITASPQKGTWPAE